MQKEEGVQTTLFLDALDRVNTEGELQRKYGDTYKLTQGKLSDFLRQKCLEKAQEMGWSPPMDPEHYDCS
jgi:hypothetical protein